jgi:transposase
MQKQRKFSPEFKREAVEQVRISGLSCAQIARELGIDGNVLTRWRRESEAGAKTAFTGTGTPRDQELVKLKRELARVTRERDFLKDAAAYFAKESSPGTR